MARRAVAVVAAVTALVAGCGGESDEPTGGGQVAGQPTAGTPVQTPEPAKPMDAGEVMRALKKAGAPITGITVFTAADDPNGRLGQPGSYTSKAACVDPRVPKDRVSGKPKGDVEYGCGVEVFASHEDAQARSKYIRETQKALGGLVAFERHIIKGPVLLRVTAHLTKAQTKVYEEALAKVPV